MYVQLINQYFLPILRTCACTMRQHNVFILVVFILNSMLSIVLLHALFYQLHPSQNAVPSESAASFEASGSIRHVQDKRQLFNTLLMELSVPRNPFNMNGFDGSSVEASAYKICLYGCVLILEQTMVMLLCLCALLDVEL